MNVIGNHHENFLHQDNFLKNRYNLYFKCDNHLNISVVTNVVRRHCVVTHWLRILSHKVEEICCCSYYLNQNVLYTKVLVNFYDHVKPVHTRVPDGHHEWLVHMILTWVNI